MDEWNDRFALVQQEVKFPILRDPSMKITELDLLAAEEQNLAILEYKTPFKRRSATEPLFQNESHTLNRLLESTLAYVDDVTIEIIGDDLHSTLQLIKDMQLGHQQDNDVNVQSLRNFELRLSRMITNIGSKPQNLEDTFNAPNLWLCFASMADKINLLQQELSTVSSNLAKMQQLVSTIDVEKSIQLLLLRSLQPINHQITQLDHFAIEATRTLSNRINQLEASPNSSPDYDGVSQPQFEKFEKLFTQRLSTLEDEIASLRAQHDAESIKFGQLGFRNINESNAWVETHHPGPDFGLLIDFHLAMEHVYVQITGQKLLANLEKIYKMSLKTNNQALAISSFESRLPRFFSQEAKVYVRKDESYFPGIKTWDEWDLPNDGYRDRLKLELYMFKVGHQETLENELERLSPYHNLCVLALTEAIAWSDGLLKFIDDTYNEYSRSKYGSKKAWHLTTLLAKALIEKVAKPRNSVQNSFKISQPADVAKSITYASLRSLDNMMDITSYNFKNSPIVTAEISKFLALNANHETVENCNCKYFLF